VHKKNSNFCTLCYKNGNFECFFIGKKGLGPLGVNAMGIPMALELELHL